MKVNSKLFNYYKSLLGDAANDITINMSYPINILSVCDNLNIKIVNDTESLNKATLVAIKNKTIIKLSRDFYDDINSQFIRHILAHEIGHYILDHEFKATSIKSEYWIIEELCDFFSRSLLVPKRAIETKVASLSDDLYQYLHFSKYISKKFNVTWITSVTRLKDLFNEILFLNIKNMPNIGKYIVNKSLLTQNKYLNAHVDLESLSINRSIRDNNGTIFLKFNEPSFSVLSVEFPLIFNSANKEALLIFRPNNLAIMAINYAQQLGQPDGGEQRLR